MKRILLVADDALVANFYRENLQSIGLAVETARTADAASKLLADKPADLVVIDPILAGTGAMDALKTLRGAAGEKPLLIFSKLPAALSAAVAGENLAKTL